MWGLLSDNFSLQKSKSHVTLVFVDFSIAFNTVQPHLTGCNGMNANLQLILWFLSFLAGSDHIVRVNLSTARMISIGSREGSVISPLLFSLFTNNCRNTTLGITFIKYSGDTVIIECSITDGLLQTKLDFFSLWCRNNCLDLNVSCT